jgi:hypothetical protein
MSFCKTLCDLIRLIAAPVFNDDNLRREGLLFKKIKHLLQRAGQAIFLIMRGNHDGQKWIQVFI